MKKITRTVWVLSLISLFTDTASEMLYPVMPLFLQHIGFTVFYIGVLEGFAEAVAGLSKGYFGKLSDQSGKRLPFVRAGYALSAISKPLLVFFIYPLWIFFCRTLDRLGKGVRTGARDAMLREESSMATRATVFGFHRAMDTFGAALGPAIALLYLYFYPEDYSTLFLIAFLPGLLAVFSSFLIKEKQQPVLIRERAGFFSFLKFWKASNPNYRKLCAGLLLFALFNSSDVFLLLKIRESGLSDSYVIGIYIFYNLLYALVAFPAGILADRLGLKNVFIFGLILFGVVYAGFAYNNNLLVFILLFAAYGFYAAATEGVSKAWISNVVLKKDTATAIGTYSGFQSIASLFASSFTGFLWFQFGSTVTFLATAFITLIVIIYFLFMKIQSTVYEKE